MGCPAPRCKNLQALRARVGDDRDVTFADTFTSPGPRPDLADRLALFAPLIGSWHLTVHDDQPGRTAEWHFSWALAGRAVADVWKRHGADGECGLSLRFYDPEIDAWRSTWHGPKTGWVIPFIARATADDGIALTGSGGDISFRWIFSDITADSFRWRAEETTRGGPTIVRQRFEAVRS
jgi:hypothetical protein